MRKLFKGALLIGAALGAVFAVKNLLDGGGAKPPGEPVQFTFEDGSTKTFSPDDIEGQEFSDIARKLVDTGV